MEEENFNPFFIFYARSNGRGAAAQLWKDKTEYPGGCMTGFILWMRQKKNEFYLKSPESFLDRDTIYDIAAWERFLDMTSRI